MDAILAALTDPTVLLGLATLVILEVVLGIDNLLFIAVLAEKLPPAQRDAARRIGLALALVMRLLLLTTISWLVTLTEPIVRLGAFEFSGRDLILIGGGLFLVFKATIELDERLEGRVAHARRNTAYAGFWLVVSQIVVLDAVFSLDAVITAVGMVDELWVMMTAVVIAMAIMIAASKPLTAFVGKHPALVILCLSFLLMIGFSLISDGFGLHIPKGYLYTAIGFSVLIEVFNQIARRNEERRLAKIPLRERTANAILGLMGGSRQRDEPETGEDAVVEYREQETPTFREEERLMISGVLSLGDHKIRRIMTPRIDIIWIDINATAEEIRARLAHAPHAMYPICEGELDRLIGVLTANEIFSMLDSGSPLSVAAARHPPITVSEDLDALQVVAALRASRGRFVFTTAGDGSVSGLVTPLDVLEAIAGDFPDVDETPDIEQHGSAWIAKGAADLVQLARTLDAPELIATDDSYNTLAGLLLAQNDSIPAVGEAIQIADLHFEVVAGTPTRVERVRVLRMPPESARG